jgi:hypothetical protein
MKHTHIFLKTEYFISMSPHFDLYILENYICIPLLVLNIPILWGPDLQCGYHNSHEDIILVYFFDNYFCV